MSAFVLDTNCVVAALCAWHVHHRPVADEIQRRSDAGEEMRVGSHTLAEAYAVLTRLPLPHRLAADDAPALLEHNFGEPGRVVALDVAAYWETLRRVAAEDMVGGRIYDALIATAARLAGASALITLNIRHFSDFSDADLAVVSPVPG